MSDAAQWTASSVFARHALSSDVAALPPATKAAVKAFTLDTVAVGIAGAKARYAAEVRATAARWGEARAGGVGLWGGGGALPEAHAAFVNAFQAHCQEFDCVHEAAVLHPFTVVVPALLAHAEARGLPGPDYLAACAAGVDVAVSLGVAATTQIRFFRPATCGLFGATAALCRARALSEDKAVAALGYALAFASGTMQAHVEGTPALAIQVANAARAASQAVDLAEAGLPGPSGAVDGPFGYLSLFETGHDLARAIDPLTHRLRPAEVAWKPFPTGRAAHGGIDMARELSAAIGDWRRIEAITIEATPLILHLVGRPIRAPLEVNYARLCLPYAAACAFIFGNVDLFSFTPEALKDPSVHALAAKVSFRLNAVSDPAAFTPQRMIVTTTDGAVIEARRDVLLGGPARPLSALEQRQKLEGCLAFGLGAADAALADALTETCEALETCPDVARLALLASGQKRSS